jgi:dGTPase
MAEDLRRLKAHLNERVYRHPTVERAAAGGERIALDLFRRYFESPGALPEAWREALGAMDERRRARVIGDFVAGMTDRYAVAEHRRLFDASPDLR